MVGLRGAVAVAAEVSERSQGDRPQRQQNDRQQNDRQQGGQGNDRIVGNDGKDTIVGNEGNDQLYGGSDSSLLTDTESDDISGNDGNDVIFGDSAISALQMSIDGGDASPGAEAAPTSYTPTKVACRSPRPIKDTMLVAFEKTGEDCQAW